MFYSVDSVRNARCFESRHQWFVAGLFVGTLGRIHFRLRLFAALPLGTEPCSCGLITRSSVVNLCICSALKYYLPSSIIVVSVSLQGPDWCSLYNKTELSLTPHWFVPFILNQSILAKPETVKTQVQALFSLYAQDNAIFDNWKDFTLITDNN